MATGIFQETIDQYQFYLRLAKLWSELCDQLYNYVTKFELLSDSQFGFRKSHSIATALLDCTNDWYMNLDRKMFNLVVLIDLKKAFDTVDHQILLRKLEFYGIKGEALTLLKSYLTNRNQKCQNKNSFSTERLIKCGVPQGSILGPLFFLLYINYLPPCLNKTKPRLFADDTNLTASGDSITDHEAAANSDLENLRKWLIAKNICKKITAGITAISRVKPFVDKDTLNEK